MEFNFDKYILQIYKNFKRDTTHYRGCADCLKQLLNLVYQYEQNAKYKIKVSSDLYLMSRSLPNRGRFPF